MTSTWEVRQGDSLELLRAMPDESAHCVVTSPPYWGLRDYGVAGQMGLERDPDEYLAKMVALFAEVRRVLRADGTLWLTMGDCFNAYNGNSGPGTGIDHSPASRRNLNRPRLKTGYGLTAANLKPKDLVGMPWRLALALQQDGWWNRGDIIWHKPNPMPESVTDRPTRAHEYLFLMTRSERYFYDADAVREPQVTDFNGDGGHPILPAGGAQPRGWKTPDGWDTSRGDGGHGSFHRKGREDGRLGYEHHPRPVARGISAPDYDERKWQDRSDGRSRPPMTMSDREYNPLGRNLRSVWTIPTQPYPEAHFATFPEALVEPCIKAGSPAGGMVLDPFCGSGTVGLVALRHGRGFIGLELNPAYCALARRRISDDCPLFNTPAEDRGPASAPV